MLNVQRALGRAKAHPGLPADVADAKTGNVLDVQQAAGGQASRLGLAPDISGPKAANLLSVQHDLGGDGGSVGDEVPQPMEMQNKNVLNIQHDLDGTLTRRDAQVLATNQLAT